MARRITAFTTLTPTATADTTNLVDNTYPFLIRGGSTTQVNYIWEVSITGQAASSSSPTFMLLSIDSTVSSGTATFGSGGTDTAMDPATAALGAPVVAANSFATTKPQRSATAHLLNCSLNAYGGNFFWRANRVEECVKLAGSAAPATGLAGEASLSAFTGGTAGAIGAHMIYESQ